MAQEASAELIERAKQDRVGFGPLYDLYVNRIYRFALVHSLSREDAEDLTALTFERALGAIARYRDLGVPFSHWLFHIAANLAIDRARRSPGMVIQGDEAFRAIGSPDEFAHPQQLVERWERANQLLACLGRLPQEQQEAVRLRFFGERSFAEIGEAMAKSEDAAKQLVYRGVRRLRMSLPSEVLRDG